MAMHIGSSHHVFQGVVLEFYAELSYMLKGCQVGSPEIISSHTIKKLLKKCHSSVMAQISAIQVFKESTSEIHHYLEIFLTNHQQAFETQNGLPPSK